MSRRMWVLVGLLAVGCTRGHSGGSGKEGAAAPAPVLPTVEILVDGNPVTAEVADDPDLRSHGLMERPGLRLDHGMVFVYPDEQPRSFWMKNTMLPLSIAFVDAGGRIVRLADMEPFDETPVPSLHPAMYALEMEQGWFAAHGVQLGEKVTGLPGPSRK